MGETPKRGDLVVLPGMTTVVETVLEYDEDANCWVVKDDPDEMEAETLKVERYPEGDTTYRRAWKVA